MKKQSAEIELSGKKAASVAMDGYTERKQLEAMIVEIADHERRRLSADLHDGLGQELTGIGLMLHSLVRRGNSAAIHVSQELEEIVRLVDRAIQHVRAVAFEISPIRLESGRLLSALESLASRHRDNYGLDVRLRLMICSPSRIDDFAATHLYLIAQEAIHNAVKHGHANSVLVALRSNRTGLCLSITDNGVGIADGPARGAGMGLKIMEYRIAMIGGVMQIKGLPIGGTRLRAVCPHRIGGARSEG
jgi:signal transduction histidine kinase